MLQAQPATTPRQVSLCEAQSSLTQWSEYALEEALPSCILWSHNHCQQCHSYHGCNSNAYCVHPERSGSEIFLGLQNNTRQTVDKSNSYYVSGSIHTVLLDNLKPNTTYYYRYRSQAWKAEKHLRSSLQHMMPCRS